MMHSLLLTALSALLVSCNAAKPLIKNGGFESGRIAPWTPNAIESSPGSIIQVVQPGLAGTENALELIPPQPPNPQIASQVTSIFQNVTWVAGHTYQVNFQVTFAKSVPSGVQVYGISSDGHLAGLYNYQSPEPPILPATLYVGPLSYTAPSNEQGNGMLQIDVETFGPYSAQQTFTLDNINVVRG